ncbi:hypothetical protein AVEN_162903-1 [Araneus ventricosus]|uniref:Uncharacterized protein n=1 Tax=Araneus ventricosus TaxID=182803 RepID=A0A4Y2Q327_ARAVE|nr:hypothetical protein AVEN_162903-1 [Araneus ventricosus]
MVKIGERVPRKNITEQHAVLISEPGSIYLGHVAPTSGTSHKIKASILTFLEKKLIVLSCKLLGVMVQGFVTFRPASDHVNYTAYQEVRVTGLAAEELSTSNS